MLELKDVHSYYSHIHAIKGISMTVPDASLVGIIGANGAGKTTTLRTISGIMKPRSGEVFLDGQPIHNLDSSEIVKRGIAQCPEERKIWPQMDVLEHLELGAYQRKDKGAIQADLERVYKYFPRLEERRNQKAGTLSGGEQQMLAIARALMSAPKIIMFDEPSLGLAPILVEQIGEIIKEIHASGMTVLLVEQNAFLALTLSETCYVLETGEVSVSGPSKDLLQNEDVKRAYLGG
ncbi:MAG: ABC transporter ATP-binding protein [Nitrospinota bacterium]|nr:ABC transporter ATP-binding protein [Nitrospinota bacterium]